MPAPGPIVMPALGPIVMPALVSIVMPALVPIVIPANAGIHFLFTRFTVECHHANNFSRDGNGRNAPHQ